MKKILVLAIVMAVPLMADAAISVSDTTNPTVLRNGGYSLQTTDAVSVSKARSSYEEFYTKDEKSFKKQNWFVKFWRKLYVYADPAAEDYSFYHHDTNTTPSYKDF